jgi:hypothetical protein
LRLAGREDEEAGDRKKTCYRKKIACMHQKIIVATLFIAYLKQQQEGRKRRTAEPWEYTPL